MRISHCELYNFRAALRRPVSGNNTTVRNGIYVKLVLTDGNEAYGEIAPLPGFSDETLDEARRQSLEVGKALSGLSLDFEVLPSILSDSALRASVACGFELAVLGLRRTVGGKDFLPRRRNRVNVCALLSGSLDEIVSHTRSCVEAGYTTFKLKVGRCRPEEDRVIINRVSETIGPHGRLRLDANRAWSLEEARGLLASIASLRIEYVEEPLRDWSGLAELSRQLSRGIPVPIALDESTPAVLESIGSMEELDWVRAFVIKPMIRGGYSGAVQLAAESVRFGMEPVVSSSFETRVGHFGLVSLSASIPGSGWAAGLDTLGYFSGEPEGPVGACADLRKMDLPEPDPGLSLRRIL